MDTEALNMDVDALNTDTDLYSCGITKFGNHSLVWHPPFDPERAFTYIRKQTRYNKTAKEHYMYYVCQDCRLIRDREVKERPDCPQWSAPRITVTQSNVVIRSPELSFLEHRCPRKTRSMVKETGVKLEMKYEVKSESSIMSLENAADSFTGPSTPTSLSEASPPPPPPPPAAPISEPVEPKPVVVVEPVTAPPPPPANNNNPVLNSRVLTNLQSPAPRRPKRKLDAWGQSMIEKRRLEEKPVVKEDEEQLRALFPTYDSLIAFTSKLIGLFSAAAVAQTGQNPAAVIAPGLKE